MFFQIEYFTSCLTNKMTTNTSKINLPVNIDFDKASLAWRANKYRPRNSNSWRYYDNRHLGYKTPIIAYPAHKPRCGYINPETQIKCNHKSYFTKTHKNELINIRLINDVDYLDGTFCWLHKKYESAWQQNIAKLANAAKLRSTQYL